MSHSLSDEFAPKVAAALGIPIDNCTGMLISMEVGEPVRVRAAYLVDGVAAEKVFELLDKLEAKNADNPE